MSQTNPNNNPGPKDAMSDGFVSPPYTELEEIMQVSDVSAEIRSEDFDRYAREWDDDVEQSRSVSRASSRASSVSGVVMRRKRFSIDADIDYQPKRNSVNLSNISVNADNSNRDTSEYNHNTQTKVQKKTRPISMPSLGMVTRSRMQNFPIKKRAWNVGTLFKSTPLMNTCDIESVSSNTSSEPAPITIEEIESTDSDKEIDVGSIEQLPREYNTESIEVVQPSSILQNREEFTLNLPNESDRSNEESSDNGIIEASQVMVAKQKRRRRKVKRDAKYNDDLILGRRRSDSSSDTLCNSPPYKPWAGRTSPIANEENVVTKQKMPAGKDALFREFLGQLDTSNSADEVSSQQYVDMYYCGLPRGASNEQILSEPQHPICGTQSQVMLDRHGSLSDNSNYVVSPTRNAIESVASPEVTVPQIRPTITTPTRRHSDGSTNVPLLAHFQANDEAAAADADKTVSLSPAGETNQMPSHKVTVSKVAIAEVHREVRVMLRKINEAEVVNQSNRQPLVFEQPPRPPMIPNEGVLTRAQSTLNNYDDTNEAQNELIGMERCWTNAAVLPERPKQQQLLQVQCEAAKLPAPLPIEAFEAIDWNHVQKYNKRQLVPGHRFKTPEELKFIPRRHAKFPFCHPGPVADTVSGTRDWYYADSIVQSIKLVNRSVMHYVVRWVGYEDAYNTVEPERNLLGTAVLLLHKLQRYATASRSIGPVLLRRSCRQIDAVPVPISSKQPESVQNEKFLKTMKRLDEHLDQEKLADRYYHEIGFVARGDGDADGKVVQALKHQFDFIERVFFPIVDEMCSQGFHMSKKYLGTIFGKNRSKTLQTLKVTTIDKHESINTFTFAGLKAAGTTNGSTQYVSFFVFTKHGSNETADEKHMNMHVCVYTVRSSNEGKDCVYYDPAAESHGHYIPKCIRDLRKPVLRSSTRLYGAPSQREDCMYQCFKYVIGLHSGQIKFEPNVNQKYFPRI